MILKVTTYPDYDTTCNYQAIVETDSYTEYQFILQHLAKAEQEYKEYLRKQTKGDNHAR